MKKQKKGQKIVRRVKVELGERSYPILIGDGILRDLGKTLQPFLFSATPLFIVSNKK